MFLRLLNIKNYTTMKEIATISTISPERLNNGAHNQFMTSVLNYAVADEKIAEETHLKPLVQNLKRH